MQDRDGRWYSLRLRPYRTLDNKIDGAVAGAGRHRRAQARRASAARERGALPALADSAPVLDLDPRRATAGVRRSRYEDFAARRGRAAGYDVRRASSAEDRDAYAPTCLERPARRAAPFERALQAARAYDRRRDRWMKSVGAAALRPRRRRRLRRSSRTVDITERKQAGGVLRSGRRARRGRPQQGRVPGDAGPRAAQPAGAAPQRRCTLLQRAGGDAGDRRARATMIERQVRTWSGWSTTCSTSRASPAGKIELRQEPVDLRAVARAARSRPAAPVHRRAAATSSTRRAAAGARLRSTADPIAAGAGRRQPAQQRRQVHRPTAATSRLTRRAGDGRRRPCVRVRDNGIGIAPGDAAARCSTCSSQARPPLDRVAGRAGHRPDAGASGWSSCTAAASRRQRGPGQGQRVRRPAARGAERGRRRAGARRPRSRPAARCPRASWSSTTTWTRPRAWPCCCGCRPRGPVGPRRARPPLEAAAASGPSVVLLRHRPAGHGRLRGRPAACASPACKGPACWSSTGYGQDEDRRARPRGRVRPAPDQAGRSQDAARPDRLPVRATEVNLRHDGRLARPPGRRYHPLQRVCRLISYQPSASEGATPASACASGW